MSIYENNMLNINSILNQESNAWQNAYLSHTQNDATEYNRKGKWSSDEDDLLSALVKQYDYKNWKKIAQRIKGRTAIQCLHRWSKILQPGLVKGPWTTAEDAKLVEWVEKEGPTKWSLCSETIQGRSGKQCREHWNNSLCPNIKKGMWSPEEDFLILFYYKKLSGSWKKISPFFIGRTENSIKNRFFSQLRKIASGSLDCSEKKMTSKIKLVTLLNFIPKAYDISVIQMRNYLNLNQEEYEEYLMILENELRKKMNINNASASLNNGSGIDSGTALQEKETKEASIEENRIGMELKHKDNQHQQHQLEEIIREDMEMESNAMNMIGLNLLDDKERYDCFDIETLEREIYEQCDNHSFFLQHENDIDLENSLDNAIDNVLNLQMQVVNNNNHHNCDGCDMIHMKEREQHHAPIQIVQGEGLQGGVKVPQGEKYGYGQVKLESKGQEYYDLMNKLNDLEKKVQATKKKLKQYEESDSTVFL